MAVEPSSIEPMFALLEIMLRSIAKVPKVKPGGHPEEIFLDLSDEEREEIECSICYQILKDVRLCENRHKFCYSCIFVWSTSGSPINHSRCPVCRVDGQYDKDSALDDTVNARRVKCTMKTCKWTGMLRDLASHQHTTYTSPALVKNADKSTELPVLRGNATSSRARASPNSLTATSTVSANSDTSSRSSRQPLTSVANNTAQTRSISTSQRHSNPQTSSLNTNRSRTRSRNRQNSSSPQRRSNVTATGLPSRLTSRARIQNGGETTSRSRVQNENNIPATQSSETVVLTPRPPPTPRSQGQTSRRLPTLPSLVNTTHESTTNISSINNNHTDGNNNSTNRTNNNNSRVNDTISETVPILDSPRRYTVEAAIRQRQSGAGSHGFGVVRDRLNESRQRLDILMNAFSTELDRGRQDMTAFQLDRERRRQEQLAEVRDLGRRLGQVATELRGLLSQRREIRHQIDNLSGSTAEDSD